MPTPTSAPALRHHSRPRSRRARPSTATGRPIGRANPEVLQQAHERMCDAVLEAKNAFATAWNEIVNELDEVAAFRGDRDRHHHHRVRPCRLSSTDYARLLSEPRSGRDSECQFSGRLTSVPIRVSDTEFSVPLIPGPQVDLGASLWLEANRDLGRGNPIPRAIQRGRLATPIRLRQAKPSSWMGRGPSRRCLPASRADSGPQDAR